jgi:hypothetical protein
MFKWLNKIRLKGLPAKSGSAYNKILVVDDNGDIGINTLASLYGTYHGRTAIKVRPSDFTSNKGALKYDGGGVIDTTADAVLYAHVILPQGSRATSLTVHGNDTSPIFVYATMTSSGDEGGEEEGVVGSELDMTDINSSDYEMASIKVVPNSTATRVYGATVFIRID